MKAFRILLLLAIVAISMASCTRKVYVYKPLPPGQAKKISGSKSAKAHAPGQQKKKKVVYKKVVYK